MKKFAWLLTLILAAVLLLANANAVTATPNADCFTSLSGSIPDLTSLSFTFTCSQDQTVYFGACDSGGVPDDDLFTITYNGNLVSSNWYQGSQELVFVGSAAASAGTNMATLNSVSTTPFPPATFTYAVSSDQSEVIDTLAAFCGADFAGTQPTPFTFGCGALVPVFTTDTAPTAGELRYFVQFGEQNQPEGYMLRSWQLQAGDRVNNAAVYTPTPEYVRVWWQPTGDANWYLLPSQYWNGSGTVSSEYGVSCGGAVPSYHTSFASAIAASDVPPLVFPK